ncbi:hypothetical protein BN871_BK_00030 [Paenibacillus sp. P22]|nr:hypothetical protein BN871_BK_00030 [Paenibacillus sp. P22]
MPVLVRNASSASSSSAGVNGSSMNGMPASSAMRRTASRLMPGRIRLDSGAVRMAPSLTRYMLELEPSVMYPSSRISTASKQPASTAACLASTLGSRLSDLIWQFIQRSSGCSRTDAPCLRSSGSTFLEGFTVMDREAGASGNGWLRGGDAPRQLHVNIGMAQPAPLQQLAHDGQQLGAGDAGVQSDQLRAAVEPVEMLLQHEALSVVEAHVLVDAVAELMAALLYRNDRLLQRDEPAVEISQTHVNSSFLSLSEISCSRGHLASHCLERVLRRNSPASVSRGPGRSRRPNKSSRPCGASTAMAPSSLIAAATAVAVSGQQLMASATSP